MNEFHQTVSEKSDIKLFNTKPIIHKLSHQHLSVKFWIINTNAKNEDSIPINDFEKYPVPILIHNFAEEFFEEYTSENRIKETSEVD